MTFVRQLVVNYKYLDLLVDDLLLLLVADMLLLGVLQESLILLGSVHFLELLTLLLETQTWTPNIKFTCKQGK